MTAHEIINHIVEHLGGVSAQLDTDNGSLYNAIDDLTGEGHLTNEQAADIYATIVESDSYAQSVIERAVRRNV